MGRNRQKSLKYTIAFAITVSSLLLLIGFILFQIYSLVSINRQISNSYQLVADKVGDDLLAAMTDAEGYCMNLTYNSYEYQALLASDNDSLYRLQARYEVLENLKHKVMTAADLHSVSVIDTGENQIYSVMKVPDIDFIQDLKTRVCSGSIQFGPEWTPYTYNDRILIGRAYHNGRMLTVSFIDLSEFDESDIQESKKGNILLSFIKDDQFLINSDDLNESGIDAKTVVFGENKNYGTYSIYKNQIGTTGLFEVMFVNSSDIIHEMRLIVLIALLNLLIILIMAFWMSRRMSKAVVQPVNRIVKKIQDMKDGKTAESEEALSKRTEEYRIIDEAIDELVKETGDLKEKYYREAMEKDHAELQYYQLQTEPHFFLNCLKNLNVLLETKQYEKAQNMIMAFSNHIRFIFKDNAKTVSLSEEMADVEAFFNICQLRTARPILLEKEIEPELMHLQVPMLCIQAFVENSIKYAYQDGYVLIIRIKCEIESVELGNRLRIIVTDNGNGFSKESLDRLNHLETGQFISEKTGIHNLLNRMKIMYGNSVQTSFYNGEHGGAVSEILFPVEVL